MGALGASAVSAAILTLALGVAEAQNVAELFGNETRGPVMSGPAL